MKTNKENLQKLIAHNPHLEVECYQGRFSNINNVERLHTDNCRFVETVIDELQEEQILDYAIVSAEDYNRTLYANCGEEQDEPVIVVCLAN